MILLIRGTGLEYVLRESSIRNYLYQLCDAFNLVPVDRPIVRPVLSQDKKTISYYGYMPYETCRVMVDTLNEEAHVTISVVIYGETEPDKLIEFTKNYFSIRDGECYVS